MKMPRLSWSLLAVTLGLSPAFAAIPDFSLQAYRGNAKSPLVGVVVKAPAQHHFNLKAPMSAKTVASAIDLAPTSKQEQEIRFEVENPSIAPQDSIAVSAYLCDNAKTYCVKKTGTVALASAGGPPSAAEPTRNRVVRDTELPNAKPDQAVASPAAATSPAKSEVSAVTAASPASSLTPSPVKNAVSAVSASPSTAVAVPKINPPKKIGKDAHGFWNDVETAQKLARQTNKPILIDFYGIWCPPCQMFQETVFPTAAFKAQAKNFVLLKVDADAIDSWEIKNRFKVGGYPTMLFAKPDLEEISRVVGFMPVADFTKRMREAYANRTLNLGERVAADKARYLESLQRLVEVKYEQKDYPEALRLTTEGVLAAPKEPFFKLAQIDTLAVADPKVLKQADHLAFLESIWKNRVSESTTVLFWFATLISNSSEVLSVERQLWAADVVDQLKTRVNPQTLHVEGREISIADLDSMRVSIYENAKKPEQTKTAVKDTIASYRRLMKQLNSEKSRGLNLELAYYLGQDGQVDEATRIYESFMKQYPEEFTYYFAAARHYQEVVKDLKRAREVADLALKYSYGDNQLRAMARLLSIRAAQGEAAAGVEQAKQVLKQVPKYDGLAVRTGRYVTALEKAIEKAGGKLEKKE